MKTIVVSTLGRGSISTFSKQSLPLQSAGEMIAAFAKENNLVTIVGTATAGRLLSGSVFKFGHGYLLGLPVAAYLTWQGALLEGKGVSPHIEVELPSEALQQGRDPQMEKALETVRSL